MPMACEAGAWVGREIDGCRFADERLGRRLRALLDRMAGAIGESIPLACQDWAATKAAYRFFANDRVSEGEILGGHFLSTRERCAGAGGPIKPHDRHLGQAQLPGRQQPAMAGEDAVGLVDQGRVGEAELDHRGGELRHLILAVGARVTLVGVQPLHWPQLDALRQRGQPGRRVGHLRTSWMRTVGCEPGARLRTAWAAQAGKLWT
jgi:hypothetical protein